jgi:hypothetical protein
MDAKPEPKPRCELKETDGEGHPNLCCCYIMDGEGKVKDPCPLPVTQCC